MQELEMEYANVWLAIPRPFQSASGCWVVRAGQNLAKPSYHIGPRVIEQTSFHWVMQGKVRVTSLDLTVELSEGDLFCLFPGLPYVYETMQSDDGIPPLKMIWLAMEGEQLPLLIAEFGLRASKYWLHDIVSNEVGESLRSVIGAISGAKKDMFLEQRALSDLFYKMNLQINRSSSKEKENWLAQVKDFFDLHYTEHIRVEDAAQHFGYHRSHLYTAFLNKYGISPQRYLARKRLEKGAELLKTTTLSVTEIAYSLGYSELYAFTRAFTSYMGVSPRAYRG
ncbi:AraC family transcriptional regulator [Paenibacillus qinlingensis]|uniref:AraC-like DNA-binding protein n=1 Tax=Paenibacillus qinlingensis TaxID=1837343 RepID=A0ABU1NUF6_9BACL|nr:AraC family transcriptional regulator [Paenibacillus qinlingensis]MDR6551111.1 AraC-like DNA-binding protein [Paenibacillus qinlingensis]